MANAVYITGLKDTQVALNSINVTLQTVLPSVMNMVGKIGVEQAKGKVPVYTRALKDSIHSKLDKTPGEISVAVIAGDPNIIEGGPGYEFPAPYQDFPIHPTDEYAEIIDSRGSKIGRGKGFMSIETYGYLDIQAPAMINEFINNIVGRL